MTSGSRKGADSLEAIYRRMLDAPAFTLRVADGDRVLGIAEIDHAIRRAAWRLARAGVGGGAPVLYVGPQDPAALVLFWATIRVGGVFAPVDPTWPEFLLQGVAQRIAPRLVAVAADGAAACRRLFPTAEVVALEGFDEWVARSEGEAEAVEAEADAAAVYLFTSGSTGTPKAVVLGHATLARSAALAVQAFDWRPGERLLNLPEPHTMSGLRNALLAAPLAGLQWQCLPPRLRPSLLALLDWIGRLGCHHLVAAPALVRQFDLLGERLPRGALGALRRIYCTGAPLGQPEVARFYGRYGIPVVNYYGLTETAGLCFCQDVHDWSPDDASIGRPIGCEARIVADGRLMDDPGRTGELQIRGPRLMTAYLGQPQESVARFDGEWLRTGDFARWTPDGRIVLAGRADDLIKTADTDLIHPEEIEAVLHRHEQVGDAAVCGLPGEDGRAHICALVVPRDGAADDLPRRLTDFVAGHLGRGRAPTVFRIVGSLPRQDNGKLIRRKLKEMADGHA